MNFPFFIFLLSVTCQAHVPKALEAVKRDFDHRQQASKTMLKTIISLGELETSSPTRTLTCTFASSPTANIYWQFNGKTIQGSEFNYEKNPKLRNVKKPLTDSGLFSSTFTIPCPPQNGTYSCIAENGFERVESSTLLSFDNASSSCSSASKEVPQIWLFTVSLFERESNTATLSCRATSDSPMIWQWYFEDSLISTDERYTVLKNGDLRIKNIKWSDKGDYNCVARNEFGDSERELYLYPLSTLKTVLH